MIFTILTSLLFALITPAVSFAQEKETEEATEAAAPAVTTEKHAHKWLSKKWDIDKIVARINGVNILLSDLEQPRIAKEGGKYTLVINNFFCDLSIHPFVPIIERDQ